MSNRESYYERVRALVGDRLIEKRIEVHGTGYLSRAVELLASCGVVDFNFFPGVEPLHVFRQETEKIRRDLRAHNQFEDRWKFSTTDENYKPDLILGGGDLVSCLSACQRAKEKNILALLAIPAGPDFGLILIIKPNEDNEVENFIARIFNFPNHSFSYLNLVDLNNQVASVSKAILLQGTDWARKDFDKLFAEGKNAILTNHPTWPWASKFLNLDHPEDKNWLESALGNQRNSSTPNSEYWLDSKTKVMIVGLGSVGSVAADHFRVLGASVIGVDFKGVSLYNPVRQLYSTSCIGLPKSQVLPTTLALREGRFEEISEHTDERLIIKMKGERIFAGINAEIEDSRKGRKKFEELVEEFKPDAVVLATAHQSEFRMAHVLRQRGIPHVVARCYRRAKWFEVTVVDGASGPCFGCLQGHLYKGAAPGLELSEEELARYDEGLIRQDTMLEAEPATRIDTSRCADVATRLTAELLVPPETRSPWFKRMMLEEQNCIIGGNTAEFRDEESDWAYGVESPGSAVVYGVINFIGSQTEKEKTCLYCGRTNKVVIHRIREANSG